MFNRTKKVAVHCSIVQIEKMAHAGNKCVLSFWILILLAGICVTVYQTAVCFAKYNQQEKTVRIELKHKDMFEFPSVTICSLNPYKSSQLKNKSETSAYVEAAQYIGRFTGRSKRYEENIATEKQSKKQNKRYKRSTVRWSRNLSKMYYIALSSQKDVVVAGGCDGTVNGTSVKLTQLTKGKCVGQRWYFKSISCIPEAYMIYKANSNFVMEASPNGTLIQSSPTGSLNQIFSIINGFDDQFCYIVNYGTANAVTVPKTFNLCDTLLSSSTLINSTEQGFVITEDTTCGTIIPNSFNCVNVTFPISDTVKQSEDWLSLIFGLLTGNQGRNIPTVASNMKQRLTTVYTSNGSQMETSSITLVAVTAINPAHNVSTDLNQIIHQTVTDSKELLPSSVDSTKSGKQQSVIATHTIHKPLANTTLEELENEASKNDSPSTLEIWNTTIFSTHTSLTSRNNSFRTNNNHVNLISQSSFSKISSKKLIEILKLESNLDTISQTAIFQDALPYLTSSLNYDERFETGYHLEELLHSCSFNNRKCDIKSDFMQWNDISLGNCFTFNHKNASHQKFSEQPGSINGLSLSFAIVQSDYLITSMSAGLKLFIQNSQDPFVPQSKSFSVAPGTSAEFLLTYDELNRLSTRLRVCKSNESADNYFFEGYYTYEACLRTCYQKSVLQYCGCGDPTYPLPPSSSERYCTIFEISCVQSVSTNFTTAVQSCNCKEACFERNYNIFNVNAKKRGLLNTNIKGSNLAVNVYFRTFDYQVLTEHLSYDFNSFLTDFGGTSGNYLGSCAIAAFELVALAVCLIADCFSQNRYNQIAPY